MLSLSCVLRREYATVCDTHNIVEMNLSLQMDCARDTLICANCRERVQNVNDCI